MSNLVDTTVGPVERDQLQVTDLIEEGPGYRTVATEWHLNGQLVRRDVFVSRLRAISAEAA